MPTVAGGDRTCIIVVQIQAAGGGNTLMGAIVDAVKTIRPDCLVICHGGPIAEPEDARVLRPSFALFRTLLPWAAAACFALTAAWLGQLYLSARSEAGLLRDTQTLSDLSLKSSQNQLEAERILARRQLADSEKLLVDARAQLTQRDTQLVTVAQRLDTLTGATADLGRQLGESKQRISDLTTRLLAEAQIANVKITALASLLNNSPQALAVAVWNPTKQEGILRVEKLPALASDKDYQLWVVDPQYKDPVDGGVFTVDAQTGEARLVFKVRQPIKDIAAYAITQEVKGGVAKSAGPFLLLGK
jgi:hypothetical protein